MTEGQHRQINDAAPLMNSRIRLPADTSRANAKMTCAIPVISRYRPNKVAATRIEMPGHTSTQTPRITASTPEASVHFHRSGNSFGGSRTVMAEHLRN